MSKNSVRKIEPGDRYGKWTVVSFARSHNNTLKYNCRCECGNAGEVSAGDLRLGKSIRCRTCVEKHGGCRNGEASPEYTIWKSMQKRCHNPKARHFDRYGGRGITVADEWRGRGGFARFLQHVGPRPSKDHQLDRKENDGNYEPGNVRWVTKEQQQRNRGNNRMITFQGRTQSLASWAEEYGLTWSNLRNRLNAGWPIDEALARPILPRSKAGLTGGKVTTS